MTDPIPGKQGFYARECLVCRADQQPFVRVGDDPGRCTVCGSPEGAMAIEPVSGVRAKTNGHADAATIDRLHTELQSAHAAHAVAAAECERLTRLLTVAGEELDTARTDALEWKQQALAARKAAFDAHEDATAWAELVARSLEFVQWRQPGASVEPADLRHSLQTWFDVQPEHAKAIAVEREAKEVTMRTLGDAMAKCAYWRAQAEDKRVERWHATFNAALVCAQLSGADQQTTRAATIANQMHGGLPRKPEETKP